MHFGPSKLILRIKMVKIIVILLITLRTYRKFHGFGQAKFPNGFNTAQTASKNMPQFKSGKNWPRNNHLASLTSFNLNPWHTLWKAPKILNLLNSREVQYRASLKQSEPKGKQKFFISCEKQFSSDIFSEIFGSIKEEWIFKIAK